MRLMIADEIFRIFPDLVLGAVTAAGLDNRESRHELTELLHSETERIQAGFSLDTLSLEPRIRAWRDAYSVFGAKPKKHRSSVESLYRMALGGPGLRSINPVVDVYNLMSLRRMLPLGGDDLDRVAGDIALTRAGGGELFLPLNRTEPETARPGEVIYRDDTGVLCRRWNWRECDRTKMTETTRRVLLVAEGLPPVNPEEMREITGELAVLLTHHCGGVSVTHLLDRAHPEIELAL